MKHSVGGGVAFLVLGALLIVLGIVLSRVSRNSAFRATYAVVLGLAGVILGVLLLD